MVFDTSGAWFRREGPPDKGTFVAGMATGPATRIFFDEVMGELSSAFLWQY